MISGEQIAHTCLITYFLISPATTSGFFHVNSTDREVLATAVNSRGAVGSVGTRNLTHYFAGFFKHRIIICKFVKINCHVTALAGPIFLKWMLYLITLKTTWVFATSCCWMEIFLHCFLNWADSYFKKNSSFEVSALNDTFLKILKNGLCIAYEKCISLNIYELKVKIWKKVFMQNL